MFYPRSDYRVVSIEKIFKKDPTYDFEVEGYHNYFVAIDNIDVLVHNQDPPVACFSWFDKDGLGGQTKLFFNAKESEKDINTYYWDWDYDPGSPEWWGTNQDYVDNKDFGNEERVVALYVSNGSGSSSIVTHTVQANKLDHPEPESKPWVLTGKNIYPETSDATFSSYDEGYYVEYDDEGLSVGYNLFEVKQKTTSETPILDFDKIIQLYFMKDDIILYNTIKKAFGLESEQYLYNFNITFKIYDQTGLETFYNFGGSYKNATYDQFTTRKVLIYHPPTAAGTVITDHPYYTLGEIKVHVFIGGHAP